MTNARNPLLRYFCGVAVIAASVVGQPAVVPPHLDMDFTVMATERLTDVAYVQLKPEARAKPQPMATDFEIIPLRVTSQGRSDPCHFSGPAPLRFVTTITQGNVLAVQRVVAMVTTAASSARTLVILVPSDDERFGVVTLDDDETAFPVRHVRLLNLSGLTVNGVIDGVPFQFLPSDPVAILRRVDATTKVGVAVERSGRAIPVFDQTLSVGESERVMLIFLAPFRAGTDVRTRVVRDQIMVAEPPP